METNKEAIQDILTRTSERIYTSEPEIDQHDIDTLLHSAMAAPTAVNKQPWHFVVVRDRNLLKAMGNALPYCHMAANASLAIVVCGDRNRFLSGDDETLWIQDVSAASENILLAAHALALGAVWTSVFPHKDRMGAVRNILSLPDHLIPFNVIPVGHIAKEHAPKNKWDPSKVTYR